jgi:hypothetical protein
MPLTDILVSLDDEKNLILNIMYNVFLKRQVTTAMTMVLRSINHTINGWSLQSY